MLTADANGALPAQDCVDLTVDDGFLVQWEGAGECNGLYVVTDLGSPSTPWVLTRRDDFDEDAEVVSGSRIYVKQGASNGRRFFELTTADPITVGTTALEFDFTWNGYHLGFVAVDPILGTGISDDSSEQILSVLNLPPNSLLDGDFISIYQLVELTAYTSGDLERSIKFAGTLIKTASETPSGAGIFTLQESVAIMFDGDAADALVVVMGSGASIGRIDTTAAIAITLTGKTTVAAAGNAYRHRYGKAAAHR